jgi:hypothetical protein
MWFLEEKKLFQAHDACQGRRSASLPSLCHVCHARWWIIEGWGGPLQIESSAYTGSLPLSLRLIELYCFQYFFPYYSIIKGVYRTRILNVALSDRKKIWEEENQFSRDVASVHAWDYIPSFHVWLNGTNHTATISYLLLMSYIYD